MDEGGKPGLPGGIEEQPEPKRRREAKRTKAGAAATRRRRMAAEAAPADQVFSVGRVGESDRAARGGGDSPQTPEAGRGGARTMPQPRRDEPAAAGGFDMLPTAVADQLRDVNPLNKLLPVDWTEITRALSALSTRAMTDPFHATAAAANFGIRMWQETAEAWLSTTARFWGASPADQQHAGRGGGETDKRFDAPEWENHPFFRLLKQTYIAASEQLLKEADREDVDPAERQRLLFHIRQFVDAMSPTLFLPTNPAALRRALETGGGSVADGMRNLLADMREGRLSLTDTQAFAPGKNLALTPGKVVFRNRILELIQYSPRTEKTHAVPLLVMPPWINKYYILDLQPKNSMVGFLLDQGFTVFMVSWKNPDASMEDVTFEDYMTEGPLAASNAIREITGSERVNPVGYCIGGTLLATTLAYLAARKDDRFGAVTFMVSLQDFAEVGDTAMFMDEPQIEYMERQMLERGYLDSSHMSNMFNLLRSNDLIWSTVVNNYLLGNKPPAFDLLYWNSDGTRMARDAHSFYLRNTYLENNLVKPGKIKMLGVPIDLSRIRNDIYAVGAEKDHIVPWRSAWRITQLASGRIRFVLAASGHIAGMINPPAKAKGGHWTNESPDAMAARTPEEWLRDAKQHVGSWWTDWAKWLAARSGEMVPAPKVGSAAYPPLVDAPGTYVLEK
ncbi:MAG TPA: class I poly(R)-hydroxyalkanoic acid synthase [Stellaceae bacterium]